MKSESFFIDHGKDLRLTQLCQTYTSGVSYNKIDVKIKREGRAILDFTNSIVLDRENAWKRHLF